MMLLLTSTFLAAALLVLRLLHRRRVARAVSALRGKHVWVVGASRGIGRAVALHLASLGATLTVSSRPSPALRQLEHRLLQSSSLHTALPLDVTDVDAVSAAVQRVLRRRHVDVVLANAGINHQNKPFSMLDTAHIDSVLDTNFRSVAHLFSRVLPALTKRGGVLCAVSSLAAYRGVSGGSVYCASKAALTALCQSLNVELYHSKVRVVCVHPGFVDTSAICNLNNPKPFLITEHQAAVHIVEAIAMNYAHYGFPWIMENVVLNFSACVPTPIYNFVMSNVNVYR